ncbi:MAG: hypothetical protein RL494_869 [Bacteroidota bacterium]|jgi:hypothetical protein
MEILSGNFQNLKEIHEYNLAFDYSGVKVDRVSEEEFLADRMKKREGNGNDIKFKNSWFADRENRYEPKFITSFNQRFKTGTVKVEKNNSNSKYTLLVKTTWIHPGFNVGVMHNSALIIAVLTVFETANPSHTLLSVKYEKVGGKGKFAGPLGFLDYNAGYRISESYAKLAKTFASHIKRKNKIK